MNFPLSLPSLPAALENFCLCVWSGERLEAAFSCFSQARSMVSGSILLGMVCSVASTVLTNIGILMQKHSADVEAGQPLWRRWRFWMGFTVNLGSEVGLTTVALALAPLSFIAPLAGLAVVFNAVIAHFGCVRGVKEKMRRKEWLATVGIMIGVSLVAVSGPGGGGEDEAPPMVTVAELPPAFENLAFHLYAGISAAIVVLWLVVTEQRCSKRLRQRWRPADDSMAASVGSSFTSALTSGFSVCCSLQARLGPAS